MAITTTLCQRFINDNHIGDCRVLRYCGGSETQDGMQSANKHRVLIHNFEISTGTDVSYGCLQLRLRVLVVDAATVIAREIWLRARLHCARDFTDA